MNSHEIAQRRLANQSITGARCATAGEVVHRLGAVQAQDYLGALWAVGLRMEHAIEADVEQAIAERTIVRTWPIRGTLHFVAAPDVRWMLALLASRVASTITARFRQLEIDDVILERSKDVVGQALEGGKQLSRPAMYQVLETAGIASSGPRANNILGYLAQTGLICFGAREGKQPSFVLLDEWLPPTRPLERDHALAELARRYFTGHGPATVQDLMWWSGLGARDVRAGIALAGPALLSVEVDDQTYWMAADAPGAGESLPVVHALAPFDEFLLGYRDRSAVIDPEDLVNVNPGNNGMFSPIIVSNGRVVGTWKRAIKKSAVIVTPHPFTNLTADERQGFEEAADRYGRFLGLPALVA